MLLFSSFRFWSQINDNRSIVSTMGYSKFLSSSLCLLSVFLLFSRALSETVLAGYPSDNVESSGDSRPAFFPLKSPKGPKDRSVSDLLAQSSEFRGHSSSEHDYPVHYATYQTRGGYNPLFIIAISTFGVLSVILLLQLLGVQTFRSYKSVFGLPFDLNLNRDMIPELMTKVADWIEQSSWAKEESGVQKRSIDSTGKPSNKGYGIHAWVVAYRRDPVEYQCVRKLACETLANSTMAERSIKSPLGDTLMTVLGRVVEDGSDIVTMIKDVIGNPEMCVYMTDEDDICGA